MTGRATMTGNATMTRRATGYLKKSGPRKKGFWPFSLAGWFYMDRNNAVWSGHIVAPLWIPHLPIFGKNWPQAPWGPKKGHMAARRAVFWPLGWILAWKSVFCYRTPDFVNGPFVTLDDIFDLAPSDRFLVAVRLLGGSFSGHRAGFWPENPFFPIGPRISSMARL